jgi:hypothetical protein
VLPACTENMRKDFALAANTVFSDFEVNGLNFVKNCLKETGMENLCASFVCTTKLCKTAKFP